MKGTQIIPLSRVFPPRGQLALLNAQQHLHRLFGGNEDEGVTHALQYQSNQILAQMGRYSEIEVHTNGITPEALETIDEQASTRTQLIVHKDAWNHHIYSDRRYPYHGPVLVIAGRYCQQDTFSVSDLLCLQRYAVYREYSEDDMAILTMPSDGVLQEAHNRFGRIQQVLFEIFNNFDYEGLASLPFLIHDMAMCIEENPNNTEKCRGLMAQYLNNSIHEDA